MNIKLTYVKIEIKGETYVNLTEREDFKMKKLVLVFTTLLLMFSLFGCNLKPTSTESNNKITEEEPYKIYQLAVNAGYNGTYNEWLNSIKGEKGDPGVGVKSVVKTGTEGLVDTYTITLTNGSTYTFTVTNGKSAYELAVENGFQGTLEEWLDSLKNEESSEEGTEGLDFYLLADGTYAVSIGYAYYQKDIVFPKTHKGKTVSKITGSLYNFNHIIYTQESNIESITIPNSVKTIDLLALNEYSLLNNIVFDGSTEEWNQVEQYLSWYDLPSNVVVHCKDGDACIQHSWDSGVTIKEPTEEEDGEKKYTCTVCGATKTETIKKNNKTDFSNVAYDGSEVTIKFYHTMSATTLQPTLETYIAEFNKIYPNIHIVHEQVGGYDDVRDQISKEITVGAQPNIAYCYPDHVALYNLAGAVVKLDSLISSQESDGNGGILGLTQAQIDDFIPCYYEEGKQFGDGAMYTLPFSKSTEVLYYNKTFFEENNLQVPTHWFSTDDNDTTSMEYVCKRIKEIDTNPQTYPLGYDSEANWFITMCEQYGSPYTSATGDHFLFNNDTNKTFVKKFREWHQKGYVTTQQIYGAYTSGLFVQTDPAEAHSYMSIGSSAGANHQRPAKTDNGYEFEVGIASIPQVNAENPKIISQGPSVCIFSKSNPQEVIASWLFVKFLTTSVEFQAEFSMASGYVSVIKSVNQNPVYAEFLAGANGGDHVAALSAKICLEQANAYFSSPAFLGSSRARDQVGQLFINILTSTEEDVDAMINRMFANAISECE